MLWTLVAAGCSGEAEPTSLRPLSDDAVLVAFGDSLTYGTGAARGSGYPEVLSSLIGRRVVNAGVPGEVSAAGARRLRAVLARHRPEMVILCHGGNDILRRTDRDAMRANLERMIRDSKESGAEVILVAVPEFSRTFSPAEDYARVAETTGAVLEEQVLARVLRDDSLKSDEIHPNADGYRQVAEAIAGVMRTRGAL